MKINGLVLVTRVKVTVYVCVSLSTNSSFDLSFGLPVR